jgi:hypothetical protein
MQPMPVKSEKRAREGPFFNTFPLETKYMEQTLQPVGVRWAVGLHENGG